MDELVKIQTFIKVVEAGSFSAAARNTSSVSSVARQVKSLEDELGVRLLNRNTRSLSLTEPGRRYYERARKICTDVLNAKIEAQSFRETAKGLLKVSLRVSIGSTVIVPALPRFMERYPELRLDISLTDDRPDLVAESIDVAVWLGALPDSNLIARKLSPPQRIVCASPSYFERHGIPQTPEDLRKHNCLIYTQPAHHNSWGFEKDGHKHEVEVDGNLRTDNGVVLVSSAVSGLGIIVVNDWTVRNLLDEGSLCRVLNDYTVSPHPGDAAVNAVYASSSGMSLKVRVFVDFLVELFQPRAPQTASAQRPSASARHISRSPT
jgi:DNA-binding transcriptional LysR family regulator